MEIVNIDIWSENLELTRPYSISYETISSVENIFVRLELEDGTWGIGAGSPAEFVTGENISFALRSLKKYSKDLILYKDIEAFDLIIHSVENSFSNAPAAKAAMDIALYDIYTKYKKIPLVDYFGRCHNDILTSITIGIQTIDETIKDAIEHISNGFHALKLKTGININHDIEMIANVRKAIGDEILIRVDANQGYDIDDLLSFIRRTEKFNIEIIEQPFTVANNQHMDNLSEDHRLICMADESLHTNKDAIELSAQPHKFGVYNIKLMKCGGLTEAKKIANTAHAAGIDLMWGCMDESVVSITAALHLALASPKTKYLDLDGSFDLAKDLFAGGFKLIDGKLILSELNGLGVFDNKYE